MGTKITFLQNEDGQTSMEYILMIVVVVAIASSLFSKIEGYLISNPDSFKNQYLGEYKDMFGGPDGAYNGQYKHFTIKR